MISRHVLVAGKGRLVSFEDSCWITMIEMVRFVVSEIE
jgi:hypothetical protein